METRLAKVYGNDLKSKELQYQSKIKTIDRRCPAEVMKDIVKDLSEIDKKKMKKQRQDEMIKINSKVKKDKYGAYHGKRP